MSENHLLLRSGYARSPLGITSVTPISFLVERIQDDSLHEPNVNPVLAA